MNKQELIKLKNNLAKQLADVDNRINNEEFLKLNEIKRSKEYKDVVNYLRENKTFNLNVNMDIDCFYDVFNREFDLSSNIRYACEKTKEIKDFKKTADSLLNKLKNICSDQYQNILNEVDAEIYHED